MKLLAGTPKRGIATRAAKEKEIPQRRFENLTIRLLFAYNAPRCWRFSGIIDKTTRPYARTSKEAP